MEYFFIKDTSEWEHGRRCCSSDGPHASTKSRLKMSLAFADKFLSNPPGSGGRAVVIRVGGGGYIR